MRCALVAAALLIALPGWSTQPVQLAAIFHGGTVLSQTSCPQGVNPNDGCQGAPNGTPSLPHLLDLGKVSAIIVQLGTSPTDGTYPLTATTGAAAGSVTISGGKITGFPTVTNQGSGYSARPTWNVPAGLGTGASVTSIVYLQRFSGRNVPDVDYAVGPPSGAVFGDITVTGLQSATGTLTNGSNQITGVSNISIFHVGQVLVDADSLLNECPVITAIAGNTITMNQTSGFNGTESFTVQENSPLGTLYASSSNTLIVCGDQNGNATVNAYNLSSVAITVFSTLTGTFTFTNNEWSGNISNDNNDIITQSTGSIVANNNRVTGPYNPGGTNVSPNGFISFAGSGSFEAEYNAVWTMGQHGFDFSCGSNQTCPGPYTIHFNSLVDNGQNGGSHAEDMYFTGGTFNNVSRGWNLSLMRWPYVGQYTATAVGTLEGDNFVPPGVTNGDMSNGEILAQGPYGIIGNSNTAMAGGVVRIGSQLPFSMTVENNLMDMSNADEPFSAFNTGSITISGNQNASTATGSCTTSGCN